MEMIVLLAQTSEIAEAATAISEGKSETFLLLIVGVIGCCLLVWRWERRQDKDDERQEKREEVMRQKDERDSESLELVARSMDKISNSTEKTSEMTGLVANGLEKLQVSIQHLDDKIDKIHKDVVDSLEGHQ